MTLHRRPFLAATLALPALATQAAAERVAFDWDGLRALCLKPLRDRMAAFTGPGLLKSWETQGTETAFDRTQANAAYVYDNAVAGIALLACGETEAASRIGTALLLYQQQDRFWRDGRLRNAYLPGPVSAAHMPGWWDTTTSRWVEDAYHAGTATGVMGWAMLLWIALWEATRDAGFRDAALRAADWLDVNMRSSRGYRGGFLGHEPAPARQDWISTEQNFDLYAAFKRLGHGDGAALAWRAVDAMWDADEQRYLTGLLPDGAPNRLSALDANVWPLLSPDTPPAHEAARNWVLSHHQVPATRTDFKGLDFNDDRDGIWMEGTAFTALTLRKRAWLSLPSDIATAARFCQTLKEQISPSGFIWATDVPSLSTGLSTGIDPTTPDFRYPRRPHLAPTAWAVLAAGAINPFTAFRKAD